VATTITVPVTGIDDIECLGGATLRPATVTIRYDHRRQPDVTISGPTRQAGCETVQATFGFSSCTCRTWLADLVEHHRPKGFRAWEHTEADTWRTVVGLWINISDAPDPHRNLAAALEFALADTEGCAVAQHELTQALAVETARVDAWKAQYAFLHQRQAQ
jgi:hypothetical protein